MGEDEKDYGARREQKHDATFSKCQLVSIFVAHHTTTTITLKHSTIKAIYIYTFRFLSLCMCVGAGREGGLERHWNSTENSCILRWCTRIRGCPVYILILWEPTHTLLFEFYCRPTASKVWEVWYTLTNNFLPLTFTPSSWSGWIQMLPKYL